MAFFKPCIDDILKFTGTGMAGGNGGTPTLQKCSRRFYASHKSGGEEKWGLKPPNPPCGLRTAYKYSTAHRFLGDVTVGNCRFVHYFLQVYIQYSRFPSTRCMFMFVFAAQSLNGGNGGTTLVSSR